MKKVKEIIIMGGAFKVPGNVTAVAEFNIFTDPRAADIVINSGLPITFVGLDITHRIWLSKTHVEEVIKPANTRLSQFICDITSVYMSFHKEFDGIEGCYLHDPMAVGFAIDPSLVEIEELYVQIETEGKITRGMTVVDLRHIARRRINARLCLNVDSERFLSLFLDTIKKARIYVP